MTAALGIGIAAIAATAGAIGMALACAAASVMTDDRERARQLAATQRTPAPRCPVRFQQGPDTPSVTCRRVRDHAGLHDFGGFDR